MKIALYPHYQSLPSASEPQQPKLIFDPNVHGAWPTTPTWLEKGQLIGRPATECIFWPFLIGIADLDLPLLAHVSMGFMDGQLAMTERIWTAFTSLPEGDDPIPQVVDAKGKLKVLLLWGQSASTSPWGLTQARRVREATRMQSAFWSELFLEILRGEKAKWLEQNTAALQRLAETQRIWLQVT